MTAVLATTNRGEAAVNALLTADHVDIAYSPKQPPVVRGVSLTVHPGSTIGIVGESGSGKTTLARALAGLITPTAGEVRVDGVPWQRIGGRSSARRKVQMIFQDPYGSLNPGLTALATVAEVFRAVRRLPAAEARQQAGDLLSEVGLTPEAQRRRAAGLSGGQCQRVGIARALACEPSVLIADEPTSALDVSVQAQILNLLDDLRETRGLAVVLVSHDLGVVRHATAETIVMHHGVVVEQGPTDEILSAPKDAYTQELLASLPENW